MRVDRVCQEGGGGEERASGARVFPPGPFEEMGCPWRRCSGEGAANLVGRVVQGHIDPHGEKRAGNDKEPRARQHHHAGAATPVKDRHHGDEDRERRRQQEQYDEGRTHDRRVDRLHRCNPLIDGEAGEGLHDEGREGEIDAGEKAAADCGDDQSDIRDRKGHGWTLQMPVAAGFRG